MGAWIQRLRFVAREWVDATFLSLTTGVTITPAVQKILRVTNIIPQPEFRWDTTLNDAMPFMGGTKRSTIILGFDPIMPFALKVAESGLD